MTINYPGCTHNTGFLTKDGQSELHREIQQQLCGKSWDKRKGNKYRGESRDDKSGKMWGTYTIALKWKWVWYCWS